MTNEKNKINNSKRKKKEEKKSEAERKEKKRKSAMIGQRLLKQKCKMVKGMSIQKQLEIFYQNASYFRDRLLKMVENF